MNDDGRQSMYRQGNGGTCPEVSVRRNNGGCMLALDNGRR